MTVASIANHGTEAAKVMSFRAFNPIRLLRLAYRATFTLNDRIFHPRRHLTVLHRLVNAPRPRRILVICFGNICRSPYLQAVLQRGLPDVVVTSAGFVGADRPVPQISLSLSAQRGFDLSRHLSRKVSQEQIDDADLVIVMDAHQSRQIATTFKVKREQVVIAGDLEPSLATGRAIEDPWNQSAEVFEASFDRLDRCAEILVTVLKPRRARHSDPGNS